MKKTSRRKFLTRSALALSALPILQSTTFPEKVSAEAEPNTAVDPAGTMAVSLGYVHDATKTDTEKFPKRAQEGGETQFCETCVLYLQGGMKVEGQEGDWGKCAVLPTGLVNAKGWCNSWAPKPS